MTTTSPAAARRPGRPSTGTPILLRVPADHLAAIDAAARARGITRAAYLRQLIAQSLTPPVARRRP